MQESSFIRWLANRYGERTCASRVSNCRRIEQFEGDLDEHFARDGMAALLDRLRYSTDDAAGDLAPRHAIPIAGDARTGSASLRAAVQLYRRFRSGESPAPASVRDKKKSRSHGKWPEWKTPSSEELLGLARSVTPYVKFLGPSIVQALVDDTERHRDEWTVALNDRNIDASLYLWPRTSCAFPGIRRHAGSSEIAQFRRRAEAQPTKNALALDDNTYLMPLAVCR